MSLQENLNQARNMEEFSAAGTGDSVPSAVGKEDIPIVLCADAKYGFYLPVIIRSILDNANPTDFYHIIIMDCGIKTETLDIVAEQCAERQNFVLKTEDISAWIDEHKAYFHEDRYLTKATYGRFAIPDLCKNYDKVIYADIDMVFNHDPAELIAIDLGENYIGGVVEFAAECERTFESERSRYMAQVLGLKDTQFYINAGFLLFNISAWRENNLARQCVDFLGNHKLHFLDQCAINAVCKGKIIYLPPVWNYSCWVPNSIARYGARIKAGRTPYLSELLANWEQAHKSRKVVAHYLGDIKPWTSSRLFFGEMWWRYAKQTPLYTAYLENLLLCSVRQEDKKFALPQNAAGVYQYSFLGLPYWTVKKTRRGKRYSIGPLRMAKTKQGRENTYLYIFGIKLFGRNYKTL